MKKPETGVEMLLDEMIVQRMNKRYGVLLTFTDAAKIVGQLVSEQMPTIGKPGIAKTVVQKPKKQPLKKYDKTKRFWGGTCVGGGLIAFRATTKRVGIDDKLIIPKPPICAVGYMIDCLDRYRATKRKNGCLVPARMNAYKWERMYDMIGRGCLVEIKDVDDLECLISHQSFNAVARGWSREENDFAMYQNSMWIPMWFLTGECWK